MGSAQDSLRPIDFLKSIGFGLEEKPHQLDRMLLKAVGRRPQNHSVGLGSQGFWLVRQSA